MWLKIDLPCHFPALLGAAAASLGAFAAVVVVLRVFFAFRAAGIAHFSANLVELVHELRTARLQAGAQSAEIGTVAAELGASGHFFAELNVGCGTMLTSGEAGEASLDTRFVLLMHGQVVFGEKNLFEKQRK